MPHKHIYCDSEHLQYEECIICGSLHSKIPFDRDGYLNDYWTSEKGHSTLEDQRHNCEVVKGDNGLTKVETVLQHLRGDSLLEIACAPGSLLRAAREAGYTCEGVEPDKGYSAAVELYSGCSVLTGFFEDQDFAEKTYSTIAALDLLEHLEDGEAFVSKCISLLSDEGTLIMMSPFITEDSDVRDCDYHHEHIWLYHESFLREWLQPLFREVLFDKWTDGHNLVICRNPIKKTTQPKTG